VSSLAADNWNQFYRPQPPDCADLRTAGKSLQVWRAASPQRYFDRITEPVLVHHGTQEDTCPIRWSEATVKALYAADKDVTLVK
jgi:uncharacterized protein